MGRAEEAGARDHGGTEEAAAPQENQVRQNQARFPLKPSKALMGRDCTVSPESPEACAIGGRAGFVVPAGQSRPAHESPQPRGPQSSVCNLTTCLVPASRHLGTVFTVYFLMRLQIL